MLIIFYVFLAVSVLISITHIFLYEKGAKEKWVTLTKCLIIPSLLLSVLFYTKFDFEKMWIYYLGLLFMFGGDSLLELPKKEGFYLGSLSFALGHICNIFYFAQMNTMSVFAIYMYIFLPILFIVASLISSIYFRKKLGRLKGYFCPLYFSAMLIELVIMIYTTIATNTLGLLAIAGISLFILSDVLLVGSRFFNLKLKHYPLYIMGTYCLAQILIALSVIFIY